MAEELTIPKEDFGKAEHILEAISQYEIDVYEALQIFKEIASYTEGDIKEEYQSLISNHSTSQLDMFKISLLSVLLK